MAESDRPTATAERLSLIYHVAQSFNSSLELNQVLDRVMDEVITITHAERGFVMLLDDEGRPTFPVARGIDRQTVDEPEFQVSRGVVERVSREGRPLLTNNAQEDDRLMLRHSVQILGLRSILCAPLAVKGRIIGVIYVDNRLQVGMFSQADLDLLSSVASSAAIAIDNARLYEMAVEKGRMDQELRTARAVQASLLPRGTPSFPGWDLAAGWSPARQVSGDYYDLLSGEGEWLDLIMADVSGKGMPAALFMALTRSNVRASMAPSRYLVVGIERVNRLLCADAADGTFVTLFCARLEPGAPAVHYVNAGHNPPLLICNGGALEELGPTGMALGVLDDATYEQGTAQLGPGDVLILYTDGVPDAVRPDGERFGMDRLRRTVLDNCDRPAAEIVAALEEAVRTFAGVTEQFDDMAILVARRNSGAGGEGTAS
jgi:sigma-B regulation protein RsbU (phosphoserine phosphatase)